MFLVGALALVLAGCGGDSETAATTNEDLVVDTQEAGGPEWVRPKKDPAPAKVITRFVEAAIEKDYRGMWNSFSGVTQQRVASSFEEFRKTAATDFAASVGNFQRGAYETVNSFRVDAGHGFASIAGRRVDPITKKAEFETFGAAVVRERGAWRLDLFGPVTLTLVLPDERIAVRKLQVAVDVESGAPVLEVGVWVDGKQYPSPTEGASATQFTIFSEPEVEFAPGNHTVMAYASIGDTATATSWTFVVTR